MWVHATVVTRTNPDPRRTRTSHRHPLFAPLLDVVTVEKEEANLTVIVREMDVVGWGTVRWSGGVGGGTVGDTELGWEIEEEERFYSVGTW